MCFFNVFCVQLIPIMDSTVRERTGFRFFRDRFLCGSPNYESNVDQLKNKYHLAFSFHQDVYELLFVFLSELIVP